MNERFYTPPPFKVCDECGGYWLDVMLSKETCTTCNGNGTIPIYYTIQQWEELTGRRVPDDIPVWYFHEDLFEWRIACLGFFDVYPHVQGSRIVIATEAGCPPKDWMPE